MAKVEASQSSEKTEKGKHNNPSPSPSSSPALSESAKSQDAAMNVNHEVASDSEEEPLSSPHGSQSATLSSETEVLGHQYIEDGLPPWDEGLSPGFYESARQFSFAPGLDDFILDPEETAAAAAEEESTYRPFHQGELNSFSKVSYKLLIN